MSWFDAVTGAVGDVVESTSDAIGDTLSDAAGAVTEGAQQVLENLGDGASSTGNPVITQGANIVLGAVWGLIEGVQEIGEDVTQGAKQFVSGIADVLRGNWIGALEHFGSWAFYSVMALVDVGRLILLGPIANGMYVFTGRSSLRAFVNARITTLFGTGQRAAALRFRTGLDRVYGWGLPVPMTHRILFMDSRNMPLWSMHNAGLINLFTLAGYEQNGFLTTRTYARKINGFGVESIDAPSRDYIQSYLDNQGIVDHLRVYSLTDQAAADFLKTATDRCKMLALKLRWNDPERFSWFSGYTRSELIFRVPTGATSPIHPFDFDSSNGQGNDFLIQRGIRTRNWREECTGDVTNVFNFGPNGRFGVATGLTFAQGPGTPCSNPGDRTDSCCITIRTTTDASGATIPEGTGIFYRDTWPDWVFRTVVAHEIGHWVGLCHFGHDGIDKIMFTSAASQNISPFSWDMIWRFYGSSRPRFTNEDARNVWRYLLDQWAAPGRCL